MDRTLYHILDLATGAASVVTADELTDTHGAARAADILGGDLDRYAVESLTDFADEPLVDIV
jgi:hypothetical protein